MEWVQILVGTAMGFFGGWIVVSLISRRKQRPIPVEVEYWVYLPGDKMPTLDELMTDLSKADALGPGEMLLFSDIRLHIALALRAKNLEQFRPDLIDTGVEPSAETLAGLSEAKALARVRFTSEKPIQDDRHLRLVPYLAYALGRRVEAKVVFDVSASKLMTMDELASQIKADRKLEQPTTHVNIVWLPQELGGRAETRGLGKHGMAELKTLPVRLDQRVLVTSLLEEAVRQLWKATAFPQTVTVTAYGDEFNLMLGPVENASVPVRITRIHAL